MSPFRQSHAWQPRTAGFGVALLFAAGLLLWSALHMAEAIDELRGPGTTFAISAGMHLVGTAFGRAIMLFVGAQVLLHLLFAVAVWSIARLIFYVWSETLRSPRFAVAAVFAILLVWMTAANTVLFPWSTSRFAPQFWAYELLGTLNAFEALTAALVLFAVLTITRAFLRLGATQRRWVARAAVYGALLACAAIVIPVSGTAQSKHIADGPKRPNVVIIGIDSLRPDFVSGPRRVGVTPNLDVYFRGAHRFTDTMTPLARTFASWMSILSGLYPRHSGARENLIAPTLLTLGDTLQERLRSAGYRTIYATDETRFSNIDESFGFDLTIHPMMGAADFALGTLNDLPLSNLIANTRLARLLFPATYANRAAAQTYRPSTFVSWLADRLPSGSSEETKHPVFLAVHLTLPHWPYHHAEGRDHIFNPAYDQLYSYLSAVIAVDRQFGDLMQLLERKQLLDDAIVIVLSDHGEAVGRVDTDSVIRGVTSADALGESMAGLWGHGNSVLSRSQYQVVLGIHGYGSANVPKRAAEIDAPVSLVDIEPTILDLLALPPPTTDGLSLKPLLDRDESARQKFESRVRFTESGIRAPLAADGTLRSSEALAMASALYLVNKDTGRFELRADVLPQLLEQRERAALYGRYLVASLPQKDAPARRVVIDQTGHERPHVLDDLGNEPEDVRHAWLSLAEHYGAELP